MNKFFSLNCSVCGVSEEAVLLSNKSGSLLCVDCASARITQLEKIIEENTEFAAYHVGQADARDRIAQLEKELDRITDAVIEIPEPLDAGFGDFESMFHGCKVAAKAIRKKIRVRCERRRVMSELKMKDYPVASYVREVTCYDPNEVEELQEKYTALEQKCEELEKENEVLKITLNHEVESLKRAEAQVVDIEKRLEDAGKLAQTIKFLEREYDVLLSFEIMEIVSKILKGSN